MVIGKNAYIATTFITIDKVILREYYKGNKVVKLYNPTCN